MQQRELNAYRQEIINATTRLLSRGHNAGEPTRKYEPAAARHRQVPAYLGGRAG